MHTILLHARNVLDVLDNSVGILGIVEFDVENGRFAGGADQVLQRGNGNELACAFAMLHDAADAEVVVQSLHRVPDLNVARCRFQVVNQHVIRPLEGTAGKVMKASRHRIEGLQIDTVEHLQALRDRRLGHDRSSGNHMRYLHQPVRDLDGNRRAIHTHQQRRARRLHHDVGSQACLAAAGVIQHTQHYADDQQDERDFDSDRNHADDGAKRPVQQIGKDHPIHHGKLDCIGCERKRACTAGGTLQRQTALERCSHAHCLRRVLAIHHVNAIAPALVDLNQRPLDPRREIAQQRVSRGMNPQSRSDQVEQRRRAGNVSSGEISIAGELAVLLVPADPRPIV